MAKRFAIPILVLVGALAWSDTVIISDNTTGDYTGDFSGSIDAQIKETEATTNYGSETTMEATNWDTANYTRSLVCFGGLSNIPAGSTITSVTLGVYASDVNVTLAYDVELRRLLLNWVEAEATWNIYSTGNSWNTAGAGADNTDRSSTSSGTFSTGTEAGWKTLTDGQLITDVQSFIDSTWSNYGWLFFRATGEDNEYIRFITSEGADGSRPYLSVTYTPVMPQIMYNRQQQ